MTWIEALAIGQFVVLVASIFGGYFSLRSAQARSEVDIQTRVREALHDENEVLQSRVKRLETENKRLSNLMLLIIAALRKTRGIELEVDEDMITLRDPANGTHISRLSANGTP